MLKVKAVRDGENQIIGTTTSGFANGDTVARDRSGKILGHSNSKFGNTRDTSGRLVSSNADDVGLLFRK
jgi:hypothetical protein